jgi:PAS domain-containing protein
MSLSHSHPELEGAEYVVFADASRKYVDCSDAVCALLGYTRTELLRKKIEDVSYDGNVPESFAEYLKMGRMEGSYVLQRKDRTPVPITYRAFVFNDGCKAAVWQPIKGWREAYLQALLEIDTVKAKQKVKIALAAIEEAGPGAQSAQERQEIKDASHALSALARRMA